MCGIFCLLSFFQDNLSTLSEEFKLFEKVIARRGPNSTGQRCYKLPNCDILFAASVLWLQGKDIIEQPLENEKSIFVYNGDLFDGVVSEDLRICRGDTVLLFEALNNSDMQQVLDHAQGPYAFIYLDILKKRIYFGRDIFGRRSLLVGKSDKGQKLIIASVAKKKTEFDFVELPAIGIFYIDINTKDWHILPWKTKNKNFYDKLQELELFLKKQIAIENRQCYKKQCKIIFPDETQMQLVKDIEDFRETNIFEFLCNHHQYLEKIIKLKVLLENSVRKRLSTHAMFCQNCFKRYECDHSYTGILFSGGVDCAILTLLADKFIDEGRPIDLINVAFEDPSCYNTPDRLTGMTTLKELQQLRPQRRWNFVEVNVTKNELDLCRSQYISDLIYPLKSILDESLGCALWFAARAKTENYTSPCRILLVGMGADELFGGYTRHRAALHKRGWDGLHEVLEEDWQNLPHKNLGRDDRVVSDHGRQLRTPYLDEEVVAYIRDLCCWERTLPSSNLPRGIGDKILLRSLAYYLGLKNASKLTKRALQFGCRIANPKEKAHETSLRL